MQIQIEGVEGNLKMWVVVEVELWLKSRKEGW